MSAETQVAFDFAERRDRAEPDVVRTDLYPTRYTAFDTPGAIVVFEAAPDGTFRHCRPDAERRPVSFLSGVKERVVFQRPRPDRRRYGRDGYDYAEAMPRRQGGFWLEFQRDSCGARGQADTLDEAIAEIRAFAMDDTARVDVNARRAREIQIREVSDVA